MSSLCLLTATLVLAQTPLAPGDHQRQLKVDDRERSYLLHIPPQGRAQKSLPVVLVFHGGAIDAARMAKYSGLNETADREGFRGSLSERYRSPQRNLHI